MSVCVLGIGMILIELSEEICLRMMPLIVLLQIALRQEELRAVTALDHILLLFRWQPHQVLIGAEGLLLEFEFLLQSFQFFMLEFKLSF